MTQQVIQAKLNCSIKVKKNITRASLLHLMLERKLAGVIHLSNND